MISNLDEEWLLERALEVLHRSPHPDGNPLGATVSVRELRRIFCMRLGGEASGLTEGEFRRMLVELGVSDPDNPASTIPVELLTHHPAFEPIKVSSNLPRII